MIKSRTVFVVGAGASNELRLPLGNELRGKIAPLLDIRSDGFKIISGDHTIYSILDTHCRKNGKNLDEIIHKCWLLRDALPGAISIDNLIDAHRNDPDIAFVGKLAIAKAILSAEQSSLLMIKNHGEGYFRIQQASGSWLIPLFQKLTENVAKEDAASIFDNVDFVIFNYDRCLEFFFPRALATYYGFSDEEADNIFANARIIHPYGQVGALTKHEKLSIATFGAERVDLVAVSEGLRTFSEGLQDESHGQKIEEAIRAAESIVFLGFAFHPLNMEILKISGKSNIKNIFGSTVGLAEAAVKRIREDVYATIDKRPDDGRVAAGSYLNEASFEDRGASDFLYAHFRSL